MKTEARRNKRITSLVVALMLVLTVFSVFAVVGFADTEAVISDGRTFTLEDDLSLVKDLESVPKTFEATIKAPTSLNRPGVIFGNYSSSDGSTLNFEITTGGKPRLYMRDENGNLFDVTFSVDIRRDAFVHLAITHSVLSDGSSEFILYVDGVESGKVTNSMACELNAELLQKEVTLMLARDGRWRNEQYFKGNIKSLALYSAPLTASQVESAYQNGIGASISSRMAYYDLTRESNNTGKHVSDSTGNGYDFESIFYSREESVGDYDYSFAIVGDTQCLVEYDIKNGETYTNAIYDWLVKNKDSKKIQYVLGLGDITQNDNDAEWTKARDQIVKLNGVVPYSLVNGNHDSVKQLDNYFASDVNFTSQEIGYYSGTSLGNYYVKFTAGGNKYMIVALQFAPNNAMIEWANNIIGTNPEYQVIITTHAYLDGDGEVLVAGDGSEPSHYNKNNPNGDVMWEKLVSKNRNIKMIFSGHIAADNIVYRSDEGEEGNTVYQLLVNPQGMDHTYWYETGMVAMLYFSNGGNTVKVEYISTYDSLKAQEADSKAEDVLFNRKNQFTLDLTPKTVEDKGEINVWLIGGQSNAVGYANDISGYVSKDPRYINGFDNVLYYGYGEQWISSFVPTKIGLGQNNKRSGIEIGIANALGNTGEMNAIIKYAEGGTYLAPTSAAKGTWTSPSYISANGISTDGNKIGYLYNSFIDTVESAIYELRQMGYTPVIQGMWWMQGCAESYDAYSLQYEALLRALIKDVRADVETRCGVETTDMPFVFGKIIFNPNGEKIPAGYLEEGSYYNKVLAAQRAVANDETLKNVSMVDAKTDFASGFGQIDTWHYNTATQDYLGTRFVSEVNAFNGKCIVSGTGNNSSITGGGLYKSGDSVTVTFNALPGFYVSGVTMSIDGGVATAINLNNGKYTFTSDGKNVAFTITTAGGTAENTNYGTIPAEYPESEYPFAIFKNGSFLTAKANWTSAVIAAYNELRGTAGAGKNVTVLLRTDYTTNVLDASSAYLTHFNGSFTFDLGNNTFTRADGYLFDIFASVTDSTLFTTKIVLKNGTVIAKSSSPLIGLNHSASSSLNGSLKHFDFDFENVTFAIAKGSSTGSGFITACWENQNYGMTADLTFTDCTFDFTNAIKGSVMINLAGDTKTLTKVKLDIAGGNIIASKNAVTFIKTDTGDVVGLSKNSAGKYVTLTAPTGADITAFTGAYVSTDLTKTLLFEISTESQSATTYTVKESALVTPVETEYGTIPVENVDVTNNPFVVFRTDKTFVGGYTDLGAAIQAAKTESLTGSFVILMRADGSVTTKPTNLRDFRGSILIDLDGKKLTLTAAGNYIFDLYIYNNADVTLTDGYDVRGSYTVKDGFINKAGGHSLINVSYGLNLKNKAKYSFTFENITFTSTDSSKMNGVITNTWENEDAATANNGNECIITSIDFNNCTFDYKNSIEGVLMLQLKAASYQNDRSVFNVNFTGGKIISDKVIGIDNLVTMNDNTNGRADTFTFVADSTGSYTTLELTSGIAPIANAFNDGTLVFTKESEANGTVVYKLMEPTEPIVPEKTIYDDIPVDSLAYKFAIFSYNSTEDTYTFESGAGSWRESLALANTYAPSVVLLREDYTITSSDKTSDILRTYSGSVTVDLGGNTIYRTASGQYLFDFYMNGSATDGTLGYTLKNGTVDIAKWGIDFSGYSSCKVDKTVNLTFDNVTFKLNKNFVSTDGGWLFSVWTNASTAKVLTTKMIFNGCTFDDTDRSDTIATTPLLSLNSSVIRVKADVEINGGTFVTKSINKELIYTVKQFSDEYSINVTFGKLDGGNYTSVEMPVSSAAPTGEYNIVDGTAVFVKVSATADIATYRLRNKATTGIDFTPKMSITLDNEFVLNVYVPANDSLQKLVFNGTPYEISSLEKEIVESKEYYVFRTPLGSSSAANELKLVATIAVGDKSATATFTFSIPKYAAKVIAANKNAEEVTLAKDVLVYIKEAYKYFGTAHNTEAEIARVTALVNSIIGDYAAAPISTGTTKNDNGGLVTDVTLNLDAKPTIRFYVTDTNVTFKIGDRVLNTKPGTDATYGDYVELDVYAYALCETITYGEGGSYHISTFVAGVGESEKALVNAFVKYVESAADYRNSVIAAD